MLAEKLGWPDVDVMLANMGEGKLAEWLDFHRLEARDAKKKTTAKS